MDDGRDGMVWRACAPLPGQPSLRGLSAVDDTTAWVSGSRGTVARTTDGGTTWSPVGPPGCEACDFRDVEAFDANTALAMVAGQPARVYRTTDGGASWRIVLEDARQQAFFDGIAFAGRVGILFGDPIDGAFCVWTTRDGGATWTPVPREQLPAPLPGEAAFAASGTCVAVRGEPGQEQFLIATGGGPRARVLCGDAAGWRASDVPLRAGTASQGGFGLAVNGEHILLVGGDYAAPTAPQGTAARSDDGGHTWRAVVVNQGGFHKVENIVKEGVGGFRSAVTWVDEDLQIAVGSHGETMLLAGDAVSLLGSEGFHCLSRGRDHTVWAAGGDGRVARLRAPERGRPDSVPRLQLGNMFGDHMVLPHDAEVPVRGRGPAGALVSVHASWGGEVATRIGIDGGWSVPLPAPGRGGPHEITITCDGATRTLRDVMIGDVWLASGQSNMEMALGKHDWSDGVRDHEREEASATLPTLRVFTTKQAACETPADDVEGEWVVCSPATAGTFSATAFLFARELVQAGKSPLGLVVSAWGGTVCEAWTSEIGLAAFPEFAADLQAQRAVGSGDRAARVAAFWRTVDARTAGPVETVPVPERWSRGALRSFDGVVSYTRELELPPALRGRDCWLELGPLDDLDVVSWNGERIGGMDSDGAWNEPRRYRVPATLTAAPRATLRVRILDTGGEGGFSAAADALRLCALGEPAATLALAGEWQRRVDGALAELPHWPAAGGPNRSAVLWNGMIEPLLPFPFTGAIWYQGESNRARSEQYSRLFPAMIRDWRRALGHELPFYFVQIAPYGYEDDRGEAAALREAQAAALALPHTGMVVTLDCGDADDIHPTDKQPVGKRLAALALARHYGGGGPCTGPVFAAAARVADGVQLAFSGAAGALELANGGAGFEVAGTDGVFAPAAARVHGDAVLLTVPAGMTPTQVRYAWAAVPAWSLRDAQQLPAAPFRAAIR